MRLQLNVAQAGLVRLRRAGLVGDDVAPVERVRAGGLLVLCGWAVIVVAGSGLQKFSEHWQDVTPRADRLVPTVAFDAVQIAAAVGALAVIVAAAVAAPGCLKWLRGGGWQSAKRPVIVATVISGLAALATGGVILVAHSMGAQQRVDGTWPLAFTGLAWGGLAVGAIGSWTVAGVAIARHVEMPPAVVRAEVACAGLVAGAMSVVTVATIAWWVAIAAVAPGFLSSGQITSTGTVLVPTMIGVVALMLVSSTAGGLGAVRALRSLRA
jgi:hypothetical protein